MFKSFESQFYDRDGLLGWYKNNHPNKFDEFTNLQKLIKKNNFFGYSKLLKRANQNKVNDYMDYLTEFNFANHLIANSVSNIFYEPKEMERKEVDFKFDDYVVSIKNIHEKVHSKTEFIEFEKLTNDSKTTTTFIHKKGFSHVTLGVEKNLSGPTSWTRSETSNVGLLGSDISEMSPVLENLGKFDDCSIKNFKKIIFIMSYNFNFKYYYIDDIVRWYFNKEDKNYEFIFKNNPELYLKLFKKDNKKNSIDAIIFMTSPRDPFIWPQKCFQEEKNGRRRLEVFCPDKRIEKYLIDLFG